MSVSADADRSQQAKRLEQMKREFLVAQQRRRDKSAHAADRPAGPDYDSPIAVPHAEAPSAAGGGRDQLEPRT